MSVTIPEFANASIHHALLVDITLGGQSGSGLTTYYLTNSYRGVDLFPYDGTTRTYTALGGFLQMGTVTDNIKATSDDLEIALSGVPVDGNNYLTAVLEANPRGANVEVKRAFFDDDGFVTNVVQRFRGIVTTFSIDENTDTLAGENTATVVVRCASTTSILENKVAGQRTNETDRKRFFPSDTIMDRVKDLHQVQFDFGREFSGGSGGGGGGGGGRGGGGGGNRNRYRSVQER